MSGEHGDGLARSYHNRELFGPKLYTAFEEVKRLFDPRGLMNPGKVVSDVSPIENLRYGTKYRGREVKTFLDFSGEAASAGATENGFLAAAEMCNGSGSVARPTPARCAPRSWRRATKNIPPAAARMRCGWRCRDNCPTDALTSQRMYDVMDLCLMCKGCKAECPSNVDVAKFKVEFLAQYYQQHRPSWGTVVMAHTGRVNRIGSCGAGLELAGAAAPAPPT